MHLKLYTKRLYLGTQSDIYFSMKKGYHDYTPVVKENKSKKEEKDTTGFVTKNVFELQFGFDYPKVYQKYRHIEPIKYPKTDGSNGKVSRFR